MTMEQLIGTPRTKWILSGRKAILSTAATMKPAFVDLISFFVYISHPLPLGNTIYTTKYRPHWRPYR